MCFACRPQANSRTLRVTSPSRHSRALVAGLEDVLSELGIESLVVVLDKQDPEAQDMWLNHFDGYKCLTKRQIGALKNDFPHFKVLLPHSLCPCFIGRQVILFPPMQMYNPRSSVLIRRVIKEASASTERVPASDKRLVEEGAPVVAGPGGVHEPSDQKPAASGKAGLWRRALKIVTLGCRA